MKIETTNFGKIEISENKIIFFQEGIPGFEEEKEFVIILNEDEDNPFHWLQSAKNPELAFVIVNPFEIFNDYDILLPETAINKLNIEKEEDATVYSMVVIPEDITKMTTNLLGPIVINQKKMLGKQVILDDKRYNTKHFIFNQDSQETVASNSSEQNPVSSNSFEQNTISSNSFEENNVALNSFEQNTVASNSFEQNTVASNSFEGNHSPKAGGE